MTTGTDMADQLTAAYEAMAGHDWEAALGLFEAADVPGALGGPDLERMAEAAFFNGRSELVIEAKERAFKAYTEGGEPERAAYLAIELAREHAYKGNQSIAAGWLHRAERILADRPDGYAQGYLALANAHAAQGRADVETARREAERAVEIGARSGDPDLHALGLAALGSARIAAGAVGEGMELLDEAAVAAANGELSPFVTGVTYCQVISVCREVADYGRAGEWTEATERWCQRQSISGFPGICRIHRAEIVALAGAWDRAESELMRATRELEAFNATPPIADGYYLLAEIRFRRGALQEAEEALRQAHALGRSPQPLLSLIRLAQGNRRSAATSIAAALAGIDADKAARARLLPAQVEIAVAAADLEAARAAMEELDELVNSFDSVAMQAGRDLEWGRLLIAEGEAGAALARLRAAVAGWSKVQAPYEVAQSRALLGAALRLVDDEEAAALELDAAHREFDRLGARRDAQEVDRQRREAAARREGPRPERRTFMFTDIVGSTNLAELLGDAAWDHLLRWHDEALRGVIADRGGEVVNSTGDGFFAAFDSAVAAAAAAVDIQRLLAEHRAGTGFAPRVRIGIHSADANRHGDDYSGVGVHVASRVAALAGGEEILASTETLREAGSGHRAAGTRTVTLKGVSEPLEVASISWQ